MQITINCHQWRSKSASGPYAKNFLCQCRKDEIADPDSPHWMRLEKRISTDYIMKEFLFSILII